MAVSSWPTLNSGAVVVTSGLALALGRGAQAGDDLHIDRQGRRQCAVEMEIDHIVAARRAAGVGNLIVEIGHVHRLAQIVAQQIEVFAGLVRVADRAIARRLDPQIDIGIDAVRPLDLDDDIAGRLVADFGFLGLRIDVRQQQHDDGDEAGERQHDRVAEDGAAILFAELVQAVHRVPPGIARGPSGPASRRVRRCRSAD